MSKNERSKPVKRDGKSRRKPDQRILRTRNRLSLFCDISESISLAMT
jgi:hypothetical protein